MLHKIKYRINRIKYYFILLKWSREHAERVSNYKFLFELKDQCHDIFLQSERKRLPEKATKAKIQEELLNKIINKIKI